MNSPHFLLLGLALFIWFAGYFHSGRYVRPRWKIPGKFLFYMAVSGALLHFVGYYALLFIVGHPLIGLIFHIQACKKHNINWKNCQPVAKYMELQEKWAKGEF